MYDIFLRFARQATAGGSEIVKCFEDNLSKEMTADYIFFIRKLHQEYQIAETILDDETGQLQILLDFINQGGQLFDDPDYRSDDILGDIYSILTDFKDENIKEAFMEFSGLLAYYSTMFAVEAPEQYIPYYYKWNYNVIQIIADTFGIDLPELPKKADYEGRFFFYEDICLSLHEFRKKNNFSPYELYAFLYDFAPKYIGGVSSYLITDLPEPRSAFFIGGAKDDQFLSDADETVTPWQCNPETRAGDMIIMYLRSPISAVNSIWRSCSLGFIDPFFYYYRCTYISNPRTIKPVKLEQLRNDKITGVLPIVKKNMQGINGVEIKPSVYNRILQMGRSKAQKLSYVTVNAQNEYSTEKEVEENIIKPLLMQLGYTNDDYVQQLYMEIGNHNHALIPDFVLLPEKRGNHQSGFAVVETKRSILSQLEHDAALSQVRSYAMLLGAKYAVIISQEQIWIYSQIDDFSNPVFNSLISKMNDDSILK